VEKTAPSFGSRSIGQRFNSFVCIGLLCIGGENQGLAIIRIRSDRTHLNA